MTEWERPTLIELPAEIRTDRLVLRPFAPTDAEALFTAITESRKHLGPWLLWVDQYQTLDDAHDYIARCAANWLLRQDLTIGIFRADDGHLLGGTGLHKPDWKSRAFEIGYWLRASAVGQGVTTEAVRALAEFALARLAANRVEIVCDVSNERSRRVAERAGFTLEGRLRNALASPTGDPVDCLVFSVVPQDRRSPKAPTSPDR